MNRPHLASMFLRALGLIVACGILAQAALDQKKTEPVLPPDLHGAKVYKFPDETQPGAPLENPVIYKNLSYQDINFQRLVLNLYLSVKPVERSATIRKIYFQDVRVNGIPVHLETFDREFKVSKKETVDLPAPLKCSFVFSDLESLQPIREIVTEDKIKISGQSFIEVKLNVLEKLALRTKQLVLPVPLAEEVPLQMFSDNPLLQMAAVKVLDTLSDPASAPAIALAKEHLATLTERRELETAGRSSVYLLYCEYILRDPKTQASEKFTQSGTGFVVSADGKLLTTKRVVQPWKFDPQIVFLMTEHHLELDPSAYKIWAWPAGAEVLSPDGGLDFQTALGTDKGTLKLLKAAPDHTEICEFQDPESGEKATLKLHAPGEDDAALLQLGATQFHPLAIADPAPDIGPGLKTTLYGFPFGLSQAQSEPQPVIVGASKNGPLITLDHQFNPGESGAPLLTPEGKVIAMAGGTRECIPIRLARPLLQ